jgi:endonuclease YncB( thermonuclease family)
VKKILLFLCLCSILHASDLYNWQVSRVVDGDTVEIIVDFLPKELGSNLYIRVWGVDTPEKGWRAKSEREAQLGLSATQFTKDLIKNSKDIKIQVITWDKFGGRILGDIIIDGNSLRQSLLNNGYAREYYGTKKEVW